MYILCLILLLTTASCTNRDEVSNSSLTLLEKTLEMIPSDVQLQKSAYLDGILVKHFYFINNKKIITCHPNEELKFSLIYQVDSEKIPTLKLHHLVVGLDPFYETEQMAKNIGPQESIFTSLGISDKQGKKESTLIAPSESGLYFVRLTHEQEISLRLDKENWEKKDPITKPIMGIILVK